MRVAFDIGGTFTDLIVRGDEGRLTTKRKIGKRREARYGLKKAKHLFEFITQVSINVLSAGLRPNSAMAPTKQHQFSTSCWPLSSIAASG